MVCYIERQRYNDYEDTIETVKRVYVRCNDNETLEHLKNFIRIFNQSFADAGEAFVLCEDVGVPIVETV